MALRVQLINEYLGSVILDRFDPVGINELTQTIKRSVDNEGVVFEIILDLDFIKDGRLFLKEAFELHGGIDAEVLVNVFQYDPNARKWAAYANGKVNYQKYSVYEDKIIINIEQIGFQRRVLNLLETNVNLATIVSENGSAIPATVFNNVAYHSKTIVKKAGATPQDSGVHGFTDVFTIDIPNDPQPFDPIALAIWHAAGHPFSVTRDKFVIGSVDTSKTLFEELNTLYQVEFSYVSLGYGLGGSARNVIAYGDFLMANKDGRFPIFTAKESGSVDIRQTMNLAFNITCDNTGGDVDTCGGSGSLGVTEILYWLEIRDSADNIISLDSMGRYPDTACGVTDFPFYYNFFDKAANLNVGDKVYVYHTIRVWGLYKQPTFASDGHLHHNIVVQNAPPIWDSKYSYGLGDPIVYLGKKFHSAHADNVGHTPVNGADWVYESDWSIQEGSTKILITQSTTAPSTTAETVLLYDAFLKCCQYITNQVNCFKSDLLGRTELGYAVDGDGALIGYTNGGLLRKLEGKKLFANLKDLLDFTNSLFCIGFGFEIENGRSILRVERRSFFYNKNTKIISLGKVYNIKKTLDMKSFYNEIQYGYEGKIEIGQANAVDAFNTLRKASIPIINTKNKLNISTKVRTEGYLIENQRRLQFSTADSKLDDEIFAIVLLRSGSSFRSKQDEGYVDIINVIDPHTGYNYDISPARNLKNWYQFLASMLVRSGSKKVKFSYGEVNYIMASKKVGETDYLHEDGTFDLTGVEPLFEPFDYNFSAPLTRDQFTQLKNNPYGYVEFEDLLGNVMNGFVSSNGIDADSFKGSATFDLLHVYRP